MGAGKNHRSPTTALSIIRETCPRSMSPEQTAKPLNYSWTATAEKMGGKEAWGAAPDSHTDTPPATPLWPT